MATSRRKQKRRRVTPEFCLQFDPAELPRWVAKYDAKKDQTALAAGKKIRAGIFSRANFEVIFTWKTNGRGKSRLDANTDEEIADALSLAVSAKSDRSAIAVLLGLYGVDVPVASAIMTAIDPARFTVIDFRALEALGTNTANRTVSFYLSYLAHCRDLAQKYGLSLRDLDRALWKWSESKGTLSELAEPNLSSGHHPIRPL